MKSVEAAFSSKPEHKKPEGLEHGTYLSITNKIKQKITNNHSLIVITGDTVNNNCNLFSDQIVLLKNFLKNFCQKKKKIIIHYFFQHEKNSRWKSKFSGIFRELPETYFQKFQENKFSKSFLKILFHS